tara:strand:+ start:851 stop:1165 length:315 start_codon:yes stop_codon:yes gene_type:complete
MKEEIKNIIEATSMGKLEKEAVLKSLLNLHIVNQRYFIVSYIANVVRGSVTGNLDVVTNGEYLNRVLTTENIRESIRQDCSDIVITNIIELSKIDCESWSSNVG